MALDPGDGSAFIDIQGVSKRYGSDDEAVVVAADRIDLSIKAGTLTALTGASGSGKSTLLQLIGAIDRPDSGRIVVGSVDITKLRGAALAQYRRSVGFVFQRFNLLPALTVLDNVTVPVLPQHTTWNKDQRARDLLAQVGLTARERSMPSRLSGGEQQRVAIARALINAPSVLLADEPTGNLDSQSGREILDLIVRLREQNGMTVLLATHDAQIASRCDRLIRLRDGAVVDDMQLGDGGDPKETLRRISGYG